METSILVALSRQAALKRNLDIVANNMANMNTTGFKAARLLFTEQPVRVPAESPGGTLTFVRDVASVRDFSPGRLEHTGGALDVALADDGFLVAETPLGPRYTRGGHLRLDEVGQLVTEHGLPVLSTAGTPIIPGPDAAHIVIARDGHVSSDAGDLGRLRVVRFENPQRLLEVEAGLMMAEEPALDVAQPDVLQGTLERSNVEPILETRRLIEVQRSYDQARTLIDREDDRLRKMLQVYAA